MYVLPEVVELRCEKYKQQLHPNLTYTTKLRRFRVVTELIRGIRASIQYKIQSKHAPEAAKPIP